MPSHGQPKAVKRSPKMEKFSLVYFDTGNATEAYRQAYNVERMKPATINRAATALSAHPTITTRLAELQAAAAEATAISVDWVLENLREVAERCMDAVPVRDREGHGTGEWTFNAAGANKALELIGRQIGMFPTRTEHSGPGGAPIQVLAAYAALTEDDLRRLARG